MGSVGDSIDAMVTDPRTGKGVAAIIHSMFSTKTIRRKWHVLIDYSKCNGDGGCVVSCPGSVFELSQKWCKPIDRFVKNSIVLESFQERILQGKHPVPIVIRYDVPECFLCRECIGACPRQAIDMEYDDLDIRKYLLPAGNLTTLTEGWMGEVNLMDGRITEHPILRFDRGKEVCFYFEGKLVRAYANETIAAALYANGLRIFSRSMKYHRPRGFFCAIGRCSACMMTVDAIPNVRTCMVNVQDGMQVSRQNAFPNADHDLLSIMDKLGFYFSLASGFYHRRMIRPTFLRRSYLRILTMSVGLGKLPAKESVSGTQGRKVSEEADVVVIGGGPAGLTAALEAGKRCDKVILLDDKRMLGGQLVKQTHRFFGDARHYAGVRGIRIAEKLTKQIGELRNVTAFLAANVFGIYDGQIIAAAQGERLLKIRAKKIIIATGAYERTLVFENDDLPGVHGAGGVQTLMNTYAIKPGMRALVVGSGNVGLILSYQLLQSGVKVVAIVEALPRIGGYLVHAAKVRRRQGVEILTSHTVVKALGGKRVRGAIIAQVDDSFNPIPGTERRVDCDLICVAVGLTPTYELAAQAGAQTIFVPELGGFVARRTKFMEVSDGVYVAGDVSGIEEATTAMLEGQIVGVHSSLRLGYGLPQDEKQLDAWIKRVGEERSGPFGEKIRRGLEKVLVSEGNEIGVYRTMS
jgi:sarcosine oxidase subunit alpha